MPPSPFSRTYCAAAHPSDPVEPFIGSETGIITAAQFSECLVIGEVESEQKYAIVYSLKDGNVGFIAIGGAYSVDKFYRLRNGMNWFPDEQPSAEIKQNVEQRLSNRDWKIEVVLSHTCPQKYVPIEAFMPGLDQSLVDHSTEEWLDYLESKLNYKAWFCGHWHIDKRIDKMHFLMHGLEALSETK